MGDRQRSVIVMRSKYELSTCLHISLPTLGKLALGVDIAEPFSIKETEG